MQLCSKMERYSSNVMLLLVVLLFLEGLQLCCCINSTFGCIEREREALLQLKQSFNDPSNRLVSWTGSDCCRWNGVSCNQNTGHVVKLDLRAPSGNYIFYGLGEWDSLVNTSRQLSATEVNSCLVELKSLKYLDLSGNNFNQTPIPDFFGSLKRLKYLNLSRAGFGGRIPVQLGNLTSLQILDLSHPPWTVPHGLYADNFQWVSGLSSLKSLDMSFMNLSKATDLMQVLNMLSFLVELHLHGCGIQNIHFPRALTNFTLFSRIQILDLRFNGLSGPIPKAFQNMTAVRALDLAYNYINSTLPLWLVNSNSLVDLNLRDNAFENIEGGILSMLNKVCSLKSLDLSGNAFLGEVLGSSKNLSRCPTYELENLDLSYNGISGNLSDYLGQLKGLKDIDLSENSFHGPIPPSLGELSMLRRLHLSENQLSWSIPQSFGSLSNLEQLYLSHNQLNGSIPQSLGRLTSLQELELSNNQLNGLIPQSLGRLSTLQVLDLSNNQLNGIIPQSLGRLSTLERLDLSNNQLNGTIPQTLGKLSTLEFLLLCNNQLTGSIPDSLGQLMKLWVLDISSNSLQGIVSEHNFANLSNLGRLDIGSNHLTCKIKSDWIPPFSLYDINMSSCGIGEKFPQWLQTQKEVYQLDLSNANISGGFPIWFHNISALYYLDLSGNQITGSFPTNMDDSFPRLKVLHLSNNLLNGPISKSLCKLDNLQLLDLSKNDLSGEIPDCWRGRQPLLVINLASNKLSGAIPSSTGHLSRLTWLHLNDNNLDGELPLAMRNCTSLELLDLGENNISGTIPTWIGESLFSLKMLRLRKNMFSGNIPLQICGLSRLQILDLALNNLSGGIHHCFGKFPGMTVENNVSQQEKTTLATDMLASAPSSAIVVAPTPSAVEAPTGAIAFAWPPAIDEETQWHKEKLSVTTKGTSLEYTTTLRLLDSMDLSSNRLDGFIPEELCALTGLRSLNLSHNRFSGKIPIKIGGLKSIETLDLSDNQLSGVIPQSMSALTSINHLNLSYNNLSGEIPMGNQLQTLDDSSIYAGNSLLCGFPLPKRCPADDDLIEPHMSTDHEEDKREKMLFYFVILAGYATGLWGVIGTLVFKRNWRIAYFRSVENTKERIVVMVAVNFVRLKRRLNRTSSEE